MRGGIIKTGRQKWLLLMTGVGLLVMIFALHGHRAKDATVLGGDPARVKLDISYIGPVWFHRSIYCIQNNSGQTLRDCDVYDKRNVALPILFIGSKSLNNDEVSHMTPLANASFVVPDGAYLYFVGSIPPPYISYFLWRDQNVVNTITLSVDRLR